MTSHPVEVAVAPKTSLFLSSLYYLMYTVGVLAFKCAKGLAPSNLSDRFVTRSTVHDQNTRNKDYLNIPAYQSAAGQRTFLYRAIKLWN